jgi:predicted metal-binding membrane protein
MVEAVLKRDRLILVGALVLLTLIAALYTALGAGLPMPAMGAKAMQPAQWTPVYFGLVFAMWWVMMVAMMTPSASPMILLYAAVKRKRESPGELALLTALFLVGYLLVWGGFSLIAAGLQWALELRGLVSASMMTLTSAALGGAILLAAGLYQFTPIKRACLHHCRSPVEYLSRHHRPGRAGALRMGLGHGAYCLGCCWFLMALLFFGGVMNLYWILGLALFVLGEMVLPRGDLFGRAVGAALVLWGVFLLGSAAGLV